jgi:NAD(P)H-nitrite reductase large subunit
VTPVFDSGVDHFEVDDAGHVEAAVDPNGDRYDAEFAGVAIGLDFNLEYMQGTGLERDDGVVVDEYMQTNLADVYAAGDLTRFYDTITNSYEQNGSWGSAKEQGQTAAKNMAADDESEAFRWVSSYSITHFDFPFLSFGHPTRGEEYLERSYDEGEWRRLAIRDGQIVGGVLIGDLAPQSAFKTLAREERDVRGHEEALLAESVDLEAIAPAQQQ